LSEQFQNPVAKSLKEAKSTDIISHFFLI
jgi:hypothetical protein